MVTDHDFVGKAEVSRQQDNGPIMRDLTFSHNKPGKIFVLIEGTEFVCKGGGWLQLPATILYNVQANDPELRVSSVNQVGAKITTIP